MKNTHTFSKDISDSNTRKYGREALSIVRRSASPNKAHWVGMILILCGAVSADQLTKLLISSRMLLGESFHVVGPFSLTYVENSGVAFGFLQGAATIVTILTCIAITWMVIYFARSGAKHQFLPIALGFLIGGSIANLIDRLRLGKVTDFIDPEFWPAFNLADVFITIGVILLFVTIVDSERQPRFKERAGSQ